MTRIWTYNINEKKKQNPKKKKCSVTNSTFNEDEVKENENPRWKKNQVGLTIVIEGIKI